jgi:hypothetical protein
MLDSSGFTSCQSSSFRRLNGFFSADDDATLERFAAAAAAASTASPFTGGTSATASGASLRLPVLTGASTAFAFFAFGADDDDDDDDDDTLETELTEETDVDETDEEDEEDDEDEDEEDEDEDDSSDDDDDDEDDVDADSTSSSLLAFCFLDVVVGFLLVFGFVLVVVLDEALRYAAYTVDKAGTSLCATSPATSFENEKNAHDTSEATDTKSATSRDSHWFHAQTPSETCSDRAIEDRRAPIRRATTTLLLLFCG